MSSDVQTCERCGHQEPFRAVGRCPECQEYFFPGGDAHPRDEVRQPASIEWSREPGRFTISWRWPRGMGSILLLATVGLSVLFAVLSRSVVLPALFAAVGLYWGLALTLNRTSIVLQDGWLRVRTGPIPVRRAVALRTADVRQLYAAPEMKTAQRKDGSTSVRKVFNLVARTEPGDARVKVVADLPEAELALYLERALERELGLRDQPVAEELRR
ncbi:MAG TPA: hypothetical protein VEB43_03945 [Anaeromyxobacter sp.]|nr:hypothetical protein [Anaeromyxobacter sp.]